MSAVLCLQQYEQVETQYMQRAQEHVEQRKELQEQVKKLRPQLTEEIFKTTQLHRRLNDLACIWYVIEQQALISGTLLPCVTAQHPRE